MKTKHTHTHTHTHTIDKKRKFCFPTGKLKLLNPQLKTFFQQLTNRKNVEQDIADKTCFKANDEYLFEVTDEILR